MIDRRLSICLGGLSLACLVSAALYLHYRQQEPSGSESSSHRVAGEGTSPTTPKVAAAAGRAPQETEAHLPVVGPSRRSSGDAAAARDSGQRGPKALLGPDASFEAWSARIAAHAQAKNAIALQAVIEARPGRTATERARLLAAACRALATLGEQGRLPFDDLLASPYRDIRWAALNTVALAYPAERDAILQAMREDLDPVIRRKSEALSAALR